MFISFLRSIAGGVIHPNDTDKVKQEYMQQLTASASFIKKICKQAGFPRHWKPKIVIVTGSGLGGKISKLVQRPHTATGKKLTKLAIPYKNIPNFPDSKVPGHEGQLLLGEIGGVNVAVLQGRVHGYEGWHPWDIVRHV